MEKQKIVYLTRGFFDVDFNIIKGLQKYFQVEWFVQIDYKTSEYSDHDFYKYVDGTGVHLHLYKCGKSKVDSIAEMIRIFFKIRRIKPSLIFTNSVEKKIFYPYNLLTSKIPLVLGIHDVEFHSSADVTEKDFLVRKYAYSHYKYFLQFSKNQYDLFGRLYPNIKHYQVNLSAKNFGEPTEYHKFEEKKIRLLYWGGGFYLYKGYDLLLDAYEKLISAGVTNVELTICGRHEEDESKRIFSEKIKTPNKYNFVMGYIEDNRIPNIFAANDIVIYPYRDATQSGSLMVATQYELPVIAPMHTCFKEAYTDGVDAILYDPTDEDGLYCALQRVAKLTQTEYSELKNNCKKVKDKYSEESVAHQYYLAFNQIIEDTKY